MGPDFAWDQTKFLSRILGSNTQLIQDKRINLQVRSAVYNCCRLFSGGDSRRAQQNVFVHPRLLKDQIDALEAAVGDNVVLHGSYGGVHEVSICALCPEV